MMRAKEQFLTDGSDWHESGIYWSHTDGYFDVLCNRIEDVPQKELDYLVKENCEYDLKILQHGGKDWLIEPLRDHQPKSFAVLQEHAKDYWLGFHWWDHYRREPEVKDTMLATGLLEVSGRLIHIDSAIEEEAERRWGSRNALPDAIFYGWLLRAGTWQISPSRTRNVLAMQQLVKNPGEGNSVIESYINSVKRNSFKKSLPFILEQIPDAIVTKYNPHDGSPSQRQALRCFLDTRPQGLGGPYGDQLFIVSEHTDQTVYHIHDGDFKHIRVLHNPAEVVDAYSAHTLLRTPGRFDFMPWSEPLK